MIEQDYLPENDAQLLEWLKNFSEQLPSAGKPLGITPAEIATLNALIFSVKKDLLRGNERSKETEWKKEGMLMFLIRMVNQIKGHPSYNQEYGKKLGIE